MMSGQVSEDPQDRQDRGTGARPTSAPGPRWVWLGRVTFDATAALQERLRAAILAGESPERLLLCEHDPVITLGRRTRPEHLLVAASELERRGIAVRAATRGGEATYHGPGQLVAYPVVRLRRGVLAHVEAMAAAVIDLLAGFGIAGQWRRAEPGVWVDDAKICAFGIHVRRGVAIHGLALNLGLPPEVFAPIVPCGKVGGRVTSLARLCGPSPGFATELAADVLAAPLADRLGSALGLRFARGSADDLAEFRDCKSEIVTDTMEKE